MSEALLAELIDAAIRQSECYAELLDTCFWDEYKAFLPSFYGQHLPFYGHFSDVWN